MECSRIEQLQWFDSTELTDTEHPGDLTQNEWTTS